MKISMDIIYRESRELNPVLYGNWNASEMKYAGILPVSEIKKPVEGYIQFGNAQHFAGSAAGAGIICIGKIPGTLIPDNDIICFPEDTEAEELYKKILSVFAMYEEWDSKMQQVIMQQESLQKIVDASEFIFKNPVFIHNMNFTLLATTEADYGLQIWTVEEGKDPVIRMEILNEFKVDKEYQKTLTVHGPAFFSDTMFGYRVLYINVWIEEQYYGRICVCEINRKIEDCDKLLLDYMEKFVRHLFQMGHYILLEKPRYLKNILHKIISSEIVEIQQLCKVLEDSGWNVSDSFFCACLFTDARDIKTNAIKITCQSLELHFPKACIFNYFDNIIIIVNISQNPESLHTFSSEISVFLREGLFKAGISSVGNDFLKLRNYYLQAVVAYEIGSQKNSSFWQFKFDDYVLDYIFTKATSEFPVDMISSGELLILKQYDKNHQTEFYQTLKIYLENNLNLTKTSNILEIHRTTLLYRLERIKYLVNINFEDPRKRFFLLWSFYLQE